MALRDFAAYDTRKAAKNYWTRLKGTGNKNNLTNIFSALKTNSTPLGQELYNQGLVSGVSTGTSRDPMGGGGSWGSVNTVAPIPTEQPPGEDTGTGTGTGIYEPNLVEYPEGSGYFYDINDPAQRQSFYDRRLVDLQASRDAQIAQIDQDIADLTGSSRDYVTNYFKQLEDFGKVKSTGDMNRIDVFSQASPNAFQSSEATSYDLANKNYLKGVGEAADKANQDVGAEFLANPNDINLLGADTAYGRQLQNYFSGRNQVGNEYNDYLAGIQQQNNPATNPFRFAYQSAGLQAPAAVNLTNANPFVDFRNTSQAATPGPNFRPVGGRQITEETPIDSFLGRNKLDQNDTNYLRNFLLGRA